jgi:CheY-like chemotaxis protein
LELTVVVQRPVVLVAGVGRSSFEQLAPVLDRHKVEVVQVLSAEDAPKLAFSELVDLVILDAEPSSMSLAEVVRQIRHPSSISRTTSVLVLASREGSREALALVGRGVNKVMLSGDPPEVVGELVAGLLNIAPRTTYRFSKRLLVEVTDGSEEALGAVVNVSATGMLVETDADLEPGQHVLLDIEVTAEDEPLVIMTEVMRRSDPERDGVTGVGVRFLKFAGDGRARLEAILDEAFRESSS